MKKTILVCFLVIFPLLSFHLHAEIYKYIDENGQKRWTDDLSQVPPEQRSAVQRMVTEDNPTSPSKPAVGDDQPPGDTGDIQAGDPDADSQMESAGLDREALDREQSDLNALYKELVAEKKQLEQAKAEATSPEAQEELIQKINAYNQKAKEYDARLEAFNQKASQYNQQIRAAQKE